MTNKSKHLVLVFNGEIYNFRELRRELQSFGYSFQTTSDTEVILAGYEHWGRCVLPKLSGMFAFVLYDIPHRRIFAARDPLGKKPLYYRLGQSGEICFASDLNGLAASGFLRGEIDAEALGLYFTFGYIPAPFSIYRDVRKLRAGCAFEYDNSGFRDWRYWDIENQHFLGETTSQAIDRMESLVDQAVERRLIAEVPLGALLSGGIDSNLIVESMVRSSREPVKTYTAGFAAAVGLTGTRDERALAKQAADTYGTLHESIEIDQNIENLLPDLIPNLGEPFADSSILPTYLVCRAARRKLTVALTGDGGDEPFGGYSFRYLSHLFENRLRRALPASLLQPSARFLAQIWPASSRLPKFLRLKTILRNLHLSPIDAFFFDQTTCFVKPNPLIPALQMGKDLARQIMTDLYNRTSGREELTRILYVDAKLYMAEDVLTKADRMSMANSLELRSPLLDTEIVNFAFSLPDSLKVSGTECKYLLRKLAERRIPKVLLDHPKTGFSIPFDTYLRTMWRETFIESVLGASSPVREFAEQSRVQVLWGQFICGETQSLQFLWNLFMLSLWFSHFHQRQTFAKN